MVCSLAEKIIKNIINFLFYASGMKCFQLHNQVELTQKRPPQVFTYSFICLFDLFTYSIIHLYIYIFISLINGTVKESV